MFRRTSDRLMNGTLHLYSISMPHLLSHSSVLWVICRFAVIFLLVSHVGSGQAMAQKSGPREVAGKPGDSNPTTTDDPADAMNLVPAAGGPGWQVHQGDRLFAGYQVDSAGRPVVYPVIGPAGDRMTRRFPLEPVGPNEADDHDHHRSLWLTHGEVNGIDFWIDDPGSGVIRQTGQSDEIDAHGRAVLTTRNRWESAAGEPVCDDVRRWAFWVDGDRRIIDLDVTLQANHGDVRFGDTKEGTFGMRVAGTMKVDAGLGGQITNDQGQVNAEAWGQRSAWVDYNGPVNGRKVGITMHAHPSGFGHPCRWHVRTYGLFAANPFGKHHFIGGDKQPDVVLEKGDSMRLSYRLVLYVGPHDTKRSEADSRAYANEPRTPWDPS